MVILPAPVLTNRCGGPVPTDYKVICSPQPGVPTFFPPGVHTVVCCVEYPAPAGGVPYRDCCCYQVVVQGGTTAANNCPPEPCPIRIECPTNRVVCVTNQPGAFVDFPGPVVANPCNLPIGSVTYSMPSGSFFPIGRTTVIICVRLDSAAGTRTECCCFDVVVRCCDQPCNPDRVPPIIICPTNIVVLSPNCGPREVPFNVTVSDNCDPAPTATCNPPATFLFPVGTTVVTCCATDKAGNTACCTFTVTVACPPPPPDCIKVVCPGDQYVDCAGRIGSQVKWHSYAVDRCTGAILPAICTPPSGSIFPPGTTTVCCTNISGNVVSWCCFKVTVNDVPDLTPPQIRCPSNIVVFCTTNGARVNYQVDVTDNCDTNVTVVCIPPPNTYFPPGCTTVVCSATDKAGNVSQCSFKVCVLPKGCYLRNPSFEIVVANPPPPDPCTDLVDLASPWKSLIGTPNLFRPTAGVPANCRGVEDPCHGQNYAGLEGGYNAAGFQTEAMMGQLVAPLPNGSRFRLNACLSLAESSTAPVLIEFVLANWANPAQQVVVHREWVIQKAGWQKVKPMPACFVVPTQGNWDALIIRAGQSPAGGQFYPVGYVYVDNVNICCCAPQLTTGTLTAAPNGLTAMLHWTGDGTLRMTRNLGDPNSWLPIGGGTSDGSDMEMHSQEFMIDSFFDVFFDVQSPEMDSFFDVFFDLPAANGYCPTCP